MDSEITWTGDSPPPGSARAMEMGCRCPVLDNARGKGSPMWGGFIIMADCPLHGGDDGDA